MLRFESPSGSRMRENRKYGSKGGPTFPALPAKER
jgi:hypothetical protein